MDYENFGNVLRYRFNNSGWGWVTGLEYYGFVNRELFSNDKTDHCSVIFIGIVKRRWRYMSFAGSSESLLTASMLRPCLIAFQISLPFSFKLPGYSCFSVLFSFFICVTTSPLSQVSTLSLRKLSRIRFCKGGFIMHNNWAVLCFQKIINPCRRSKSVNVASFYNLF